MTDTDTDHTPRIVLGDWREALADIECDALICDPPYSARTHSGQVIEPIRYAPWSPDDVAAFVDHWAPRVRGWFCAMTSHDLSPHYESALARHGRYVFAPLPCVQRGMTFRVSGDGPSSWTCWLIVSRPRSRPFSEWGTLPGAYIGNARDATDRTARSDRPILGGKPLWLMRAIVRDYSMPGDLVCDPTAGYGTTLLAAAIDGRRSIGAEIDPQTHAAATDRIARGYTPDMFVDELETRKQIQEGLPLDI
jgi:hypothetical protein